MPFIRSWVRLLTTVGVLASTVTPASAHAAGSGSRDADQPPLPRGVHRKASGRYVEDLCDDPRARLRCHVMKLMPPSWRPGDPIPEGEPPQPTPLSASIVEAAYGLPATAKASGKIVAVIDAPDNHAFSDLAMYRRLRGLPPLERCTGLPTGKGTACFAQVAQDGSPSTNTDPSPGADHETSLDVDMISIACPDCSVLLVEINPIFCESDLAEGVATATRLGASAISISVGGPEATDPNAILAGKGGATNGTNGCPNERRWTYDLPGPFSTPGHLVFASAGDYAYNNRNLAFSPTLGGAAPAYPASSPYLIAVGGTALYAASGSAIREGVWSAGFAATTSGCSSEFARPPWQAPLLSGSSCEGRVTADVSAAATFYSEGVEVGIEIVVNGMTTATTGTSASAPLVAAMFTRLGLTTEASNDLSWIYRNASAFNDVGSLDYPLPSSASGSNAPDDPSCGVLCSAGTGWDGPSGVGSPDGTRLAALPVSGDGPLPYPDSGVCGPRGRVGTRGTLEPCDDGGCACKVGRRGSASSLPWRVGWLGLALLGVAFWSRARNLLIEEMKR